MSDETLTPKNIWHADKFDRKKEAEILIGYLESIADKPALREDKQGFTLAIDAQYGEGKTFFLKRLAQQLSINHPVAFVDTWADDLADEPLTALAATLKSALDPLIKQSDDVRSKFNAVMEKTGRVAKIVGVGLLKKGASVLITAGAAGEAADVLSGASDDVQDALNDAIKDAGKDTLEIAEKALTSVAPGKLMDERVNRFRAGQAAVQEMKSSLAALVKSLEAENLKKPIYIVIDELDRCRPTYAVKLLEEIKHLFDVKGLVFILGLHADQLSHSIGAAYGTGFDSKSYLRRFFDRQYRLAEPDQTELLDHLVEQAGIAAVPGNYLKMSQVNMDPESLSLGGVIARYMADYSVSARNAFEIVDILQTCFAVVNGQRLYLNYLLPLIIGHIKGLPEGELPTPATGNRWLVWERKDHWGRDGEHVTLHRMADRFKIAAQMSRQSLLQAYNRENAGYALRAVFETSTASLNVDSISSAKNYPVLLRTVGRFTNPNLPDQ